ncbi:hypothetical protein BU16DRAFT_559000 [Lophium mytilinum]|uniref:F-box domain-containing protein n=1 Tax=Lophium mytilinum TaxID=390894 RepID=A0A6A6R2L5_9PEZI|nr:hypothetical protein BU16DRAFT_559000 [Lophium mytilinum]
MASLINIPNELKDLVFAKIERWDVLSVSKTCKELHAAAIPTLYHKLHMFWDIQEADETPKIICLIRTILEHPEYASFIKYLVVNAANHWDDEVNEENSDLGRLKLRNIRVIGTQPYLAGFCIRLDGNGHLALDQLQQGLHHLRSTLIHLIIKCRVSDSEYEVLYSASIDAVSFLRDFTALSCIHVPLPILVGPMPKCYWIKSESDDSLAKNAAILDRVSWFAEVLPPIIKCMVIYDNLWDSSIKEWAEEPLMALLKAFLDGEWRDATPQLGKVLLDLRECRHWGSTYWMEEEHHKELREMGKRQGLKCFIRKG